MIQSIRGPYIGRNLTSWFRPRVPVSACSNTTSLSWIRKYVKPMMFYSFILNLLKQQFTRPLSSSQSIIVCFYSLPMLSISHYFIMLHPHGDIFIICVFSRDLYDAESHSSEWMLIVYDTANNIPLKGVLMDLQIRVMYPLLLLWAHNPYISSTLFTEVVPTRLLISLSCIYSVLPE